MVLDPKIRYPDLVPRRKKSFFRQKKQLEGKKTHANIHENSKAALFGILNQTKILDFLKE